MKCSVNGKEVPLLGGTITEDINKYYAEVTLITQGNIYGGDVSLSNEGGSMSLFVTGYQMIDNLYYTTCIPKQAWVHLNKACKPIMGKYTIKELLKKMGFSSTIEQDSSSTFWYVPQLRFKSIIDQLRWYSKFSSGGACVFFMDIKGFIQAIDLKLCFKKSPVNVNAKVVSDVTSVDWMLDSAGKADIVVNKLGGTSTESVSNLSNCGYGVAYLFEVTGDATARLKQKITNDFWYNFYTSRSVVAECSNLGALQIGSAVNINGNGVFVVAGVSVNIPVGDAPAHAQIRCVKPVL